MVNPVQAGGTKLRILCGMVGLPKRHITGSINKSLFFASGEQAFLFTTL